MSGARKRQVIAGAVVALAGLLVAAGAVAAALGEEKPTGPDERTISTIAGAPRLVETVVNTSLLSTSSISLVDVSGVSITHQTPDDYPEHLLITVSGESRCLDTNGIDDAWCRVQVTVDGVAATPGGINIFDSAASDSGDSNAWEFHTAQFVATVTGKGPHVVKLRYSVDETGATFSLDNIAMTVETLAAGAGSAGDGLYNEGRLCFEAGDKAATLDLSAAYDITGSSLGFAALQESAGGGRHVRMVRLYAASDVLKVVLNKAADRKACAAWHIVEMEFAG